MVVGPLGRPARGRAGNKRRAQGGPGRRARAGAGRRAAQPPGAAARVVPAEPGPAARRARPADRLPGGAGGGRLRGPAAGGGAPAAGLGEWLAPVLPNLVAGPPRHPAWSVLGVRRVSLAELADLLAALGR